MLTDDYSRFDEILNKAVPAGLIVVNGSPYATTRFCEGTFNKFKIHRSNRKFNTIVSIIWSLGIQEGQPIFIFKYTGSTADLACECLQKAEKMLVQRRNNPNARPELPYPQDFVVNYIHPNFLWPFSPQDVEVCRKLNILVENFPGFKFLSMNVMYENV